MAKWTLSDYNFCKKIYGWDVTKKASAIWRTQDFNWFLLQQINNNYHAMKADVDLNQSSDPSIFH